jgi:hypothetical protein
MSEFDPDIVLAGQAHAVASLVPLDERKHNPSGPLG